MLNALHQVYEDGYKNVIVVIGSDRLDDGTAETLNKYNGRHAKNSALDELNFYDFDSIDFISAGQRDEDSDDVATKASGTLVRKLVAENNYKEFAKYVIPLGEETTQDLFRKLSQKNTQSLAGYMNDSKNILTFWKVYSFALFSGVSQSGSLNLIHSIPKFLKNSGPFLSRSYSSK